MGAVVEFSEAVPAQGMIPLDFDTRLFHSGDEIGRHLPATQPVEHDVDAHARSCALYKDRCKLFAHGA